MVVCAASAYIIDQSSSNS